jgi:hypothetical protein
MCDVFPAGKGWNASLIATDLQMVSVPPSQWLEATWADCPQLVWHQVLHLKQVTTAASLS